MTNHTTKAGVSIKSCNEDNMDILCLDNKRLFNITMGGGNFPLATKPIFPVTPVSSIEGGSNNGQNLQEYTNANLRQHIFQFLVLNKIRFLASKVKLRNESASILWFCRHFFRHYHRTLTRLTALASRYLSN